MRALFLMVAVGCSRPSSLTLTVFVDDNALRQVDEFPVEVTIDYDNREEKLLTIELCEWNGSDFLQVELEAEIYQGCRSATTVRATLSKMDRECQDGRLLRTVRELPPENEQIGYGERIVFDSDICGVSQDATLAIDPF